jgi:hypothetical protein
MVLVDGEIRNYKDGQDVWKSSINASKVVTLVGKNVQGTETLDVKQDIDSRFANKE